MMAGKFDRPAGRGGGSGKVFYNDPEHATPLSPLVQRDAQLLFQARAQLYAKVNKGRAPDGTISDPESWRAFRVYRWISSYIRMFRNNPVPCSPRVVKACCKVLGIDTPPEPPQTEAALSIGPLPKKPPRKKLDDE